MASALAEPCGSDGRKPRWKGLAFAFLCGVAFALSSLVVGYVIFALSLERAETAVVARADGVVVFTGGSDRVSTAAELLARGQARRLLITGVNPTTSETNMARLLPVSHDLFVCCVDLGYEARDTVGNALETRDWARRHGISESLIVVTSNYHMPRALLELSAALPGVELYPFPVVSDRVDVADWPRDPGVARLIAGEYVKYLLALARTRLLDPVVSGEDAPPEPRAAANLR